MAEGLERVPLVAGLILGVALLGVDECRVGTPVVVSVVDAAGAAVESFSVRVDERAQWTRSVTFQVDGTGSFVYFVTDPEATVLFFVSHPDYHPGVAVLDPLAVASSDPVAVTIPLVPVDTCLGFSNACSTSSGGGAATSGPGTGTVVVGMNDWVYAAEVPLILAPYCLSVEVEESVDSFAMWTDLVEGDLGATLAVLESSGMVLWADARGYSGEYEGTPILVQFQVGVSINDAQALVQATPGLEWLETVLAPTWGTVEVRSGSESLWACTLEEDPNIEYAHGDFVLPISSP